jgi:RNA polymerase sigma-70 factor (ECF subfamily)
VVDHVALEERISVACKEERWSDAATIAVKGYGPELLGYLVGMTRSEVEAHEVFSVFCESLWKNLPGFRWESSFRTWAYCVARRAFTRMRRDPHRRRAVPYSEAMSAAIAQVRTRTATFLRSETRDKVAALRAKLPPDDQTLLILRINRKMPWRQIAIVLGEEGETAAAVERRASSLRKRFERLKADLRALARSDAPD